MNKNEQLHFSDITRESPKFLNPTYFLKSDQNLESSMKGLLGWTENFSTSPHTNTRFELDKFLQYM